MELAIGELLTAPDPFHPLNTPYATALAAARDAAGMQDMPRGALFVVATPIGNLADISLRALCVLQSVEHLACEDTRHSQSLLRAYGLERPATQWLALHQHNEQEATQKVLGLLAQGERVALMSDAGTPAVSDPGARLVAAVQAAGFRTLPIPGASSVTALVSVAGLPPEPSGWVVQGFLPSRGAERAAAIAALAQEPRAVLLLESPHRIADLLSALEPLGARRLTIGRELTKQFEEVATLPAAEALAWLHHSAARSKGEFALLLHPAPEQAASPHQAGAAVLAVLLSELPLKQAVQLAARITGEPRNALYEQALALKEKTSGEGHS